MQYHARGGAIVAYAYDAALHCPYCTRKAVEHGALQSDPSHPYASEFVDEHGLRADLVDSDWNIVHPVFRVYAEESDHCHDCGTELE